ncbi:DUF2628 domain-containing protein [Fibrella forsythiae]|uniref:DUF2628 domain-containing protein n=1 Tax=Fibrella forsythiae TaxID=2817061 RepID=A0ABS3JQY4_9BACT|nr:DUF2628 domain-containing protein [Fibrella forsythiae]MBO0952407.1 DUF2628 domain-containing protein [Fibrella forsythiae]
MNDSLRFFFGPQADYYTGVAEDLDEGKTRFNEGAFFFGMFWMAYRKMYANAAITFTFIMTESVLEDWLIPEVSKTFVYSLVSNILIASVIGFAGNRLYINFARKRVAAIAPNVDVPTDSEVIARLRKQGGVSWRGPLVVLVAFLVLVTGMFYLTM